MPKYVVSFPHMGEVWIIAKAVFETMGCEVLVPPCNSKISAQKGIINSPQDVCIPFKMTLGNLIEALDSGANVLFQLGGGKEGFCRLPQYPVSQGKILRELGYEFKLYGIGHWFNIQNIIRNGLKEICGSPPDYYIRVARAARIAHQKMVLVDLVNNLTRRYRAYEIKRGEAGKVREEMLKLIDELKNIKELKQAKSIIKENFANIEIEPEREVVKIGLGGEFFCMIDNFTNCDIERKLGELGVLVENLTTFSYLAKPAITTRAKREMIKLGLKHVPVSSFGEDLPTIGKVEYFAKKGFSGYITLAPMACMPEQAALAVVHHIRKEYDLPTMHFSCDENLSPTFMQTRLEAFVNMIKRKEGIPVG